MSYIDSHLQPGETLHYRIQRSRKWHDLLITLAVNILGGLAIWYLFKQLQRMFVESYIRPESLFGSAEFIVFNLFLSLLPFIIILALVQDFVFTFFLELGLTDRRIFGRVSGPFWVREVSFPLDALEAVEIRFGCLYLNHRGKRIYLSGFYDIYGFVEKYRELTPGRPAAGILEPVTEPLRR